MNGDIISLFFMSNKKVSIWDLHFLMMVYIGRMSKSVGYRCIVEHIYCCWGLDLSIFL